MVERVHSVARQRQVTPGSLNPRFGLVIALVLLAGLIAPVLSAIISILALAVVSRRPYIIGGTMVGVVSIILACLNASKAIQGDWGWYVQHYEVLRYMPLVEYLGKHIGLVQSKPTEPLYYVLASALSVITGANVEVLAIAVTLVIYGVIGIAIVASVTTVDKRASTVVVATVAGMLVGLTFTLSTQLVRQEIAAALIALAIVTSAKRNWALTATILLAAVLTHNSALIPGAGVVLAILFRGRGDGRVLRFLIGGVIFYALGRIYLATSGDASYSGKVDGTISPAVIVLDLVILAAFFFLIRKRGLNDNPVASTILMCAPAFYGFAIGVASQPIPLLRMYFFIEVLRALMIVFICANLMRGRMRLLVGAMILAGAIGYLLLRIGQSPFVYENSLTKVLLWTPLIELLPG